MDATLERLKAALADRYAIEREIGHGAMATVYLAEDLKHHRKVAVKVLNPDLAAAVGADRFLREIEIAASLTHPHILGVHDSGEADGFLYFVMPFVEGESLRARLEREGELPVDDALQIAREVARALDFAHERGVIHRDVKPENILLSAGQAVLADFGIAKAAQDAGEERLTQTGTSVGTPAYMSPEQATGEQELDGRSDLYSLGCVLYEMLAGQPPFTGPTAQSIIGQHLTAEPTPITLLRSTVPEEIAATVAAALAKNPADRFRAAGDFGASLEGTGELPARRRHPSRARAVIYLGTVVLGLATAAIIATQRSDRGPLLRDARIAFLPLEDNTGEAELEDLGSYAAQVTTDRLFRSEGARSGEVQPVDAQTVHQILDTYTGPTTSQQVAADLEAGRFIHGTVAASGDSLVIRVRIVRTDSGELIQVLEVRGLASEKAALVDELAQRVMGALSLTLDEEASYWIKDPPKYEAFQVYQQSRRRFLARDWERTIELSFEAYRLDTTFVDALLQAGSAFTNSGQYARLDSLVQFLEPRRDELDPHDRAWLEHYSARVRGSREEGYQVWKEEYERSPDGLSKAYVLGNSALRAGHPEAAYQAYTQMDLDNPLMQKVSWGFVNFAQSCHLTGRFREELEIARRGLEHFPDDWILRRAEIQALAALDRWDEVPGLLQALEELEPTGGSSPGSTFVPLAVDFARLGHHEESQALAQRALRWYESRKPADHVLWRATILVFLDRPESALPLIEQALGQNPESLGDRMWGRSIRGIVLAQLGDVEGAEAEAAWFEALDIPYLYGFDTHCRAEIAAHLGRTTEAVSLLRQSLEEGRSWVSIVGNLLAVTPLWGDPAFERIMAPGS
jgi:tRNA A-37 threonylcarbamoyl transferase component Bud32/tetratricopeptide (TPR) repeat protein